MELKKNGSDKNVGSIEDIEGLKRLFYANALTQYGKRKLIGYYEQQIKELEENSIPISLVEEKIEEYEEKARRIAGTYQYADSNEDLESKKKQVIELRTKSEGLQEILKGE